MAPILHKPFISVPVSHQTSSPKSLAFCQAPYLCSRRPCVSDWKPAEFGVVSLLPMVQNCAQFATHAKRALTGQILLPAPRSCICVCILRQA